MQLAKHAHEDGYGVQAIIALETLHVAPVVTKQMHWKAKGAEWENGTQLSRIYGPRRLILQPLQGMWTKWEVGSNAGLRLHAFPNEETLWVQTTGHWTQDSASASITKNGVAER